MSEGSISVQVLVDEYLCKRYFLPAYLHHYDDSVFTDAELLREWRVEQMSQGFT